MLLDRIKQKLQAAVTALMSKHQGLQVESNDEIRKVIGGDFYFSHEGFCVCCNSKTTFKALGSWLRDRYLCEKCGSVPRERALLSVLEDKYPKWRSLKLHESSPSPDRQIYKRLVAEAKKYTPTQYFPGKQFGDMVQGFRNEDLEKQTFGDGSFDLVISLDVMEHVYDPKKVFQEVSRTLKKGGAYIFTVPMVNKHTKTEIWARKGKGGKPIFLKNPEYHGNPVDPEGSPVTMHWGYDIVDYIRNASGMEASIVAQYDQEKGIMGEYSEVVVALKG